MASIIELLPVARYSANSGTEYKQPVGALVDVSGFTEAGILLTLYGLSLSGGTTIVELRTAIDNLDEHFVEHVTLATYTSEPGYPARAYKYLAGSTNGNSDAPGFARYLRVIIDFGVEGASASLGIQAVLKP